MMTELNSQRVSYYTGVKLIRHHQSASNTANNATGFFHPHHNPNQQQHNHHHPHFPPQQPQQHPPLHHPGHYHLPCPTGPPHLQHPGPLNSPGGVIVANGPPQQQQQHHHQNHHHPQGNGYLGGGGSSTTTRLYTGSPLIRSGAYHSVPGANSNKRSYKQGKGHHHPHGNGLQKNGGNHHHHHNHHHHLPNSGGSCSSGTSSSSSSNEHLNNIHQQPSPGSPTQSSGKSLDIAPLKLSPSPGESSGFALGSSSSANSSPGPDSPGLKSSPSPSSTLSSNSSDGNKDLDHFYFLDEHWKPSNDGGAVNSSMSGSGDMMMDLSSGSPISSGGGGGSSASAQWSSSSPSPREVHNSASALTMMVDQFFCHDNLSPFPEGEVASGGNEMRDLNNNLVGQGADILEMGNQNRLPPHQHNHLHRHHSFSGFHSSAVGSHRQGGGTAGLLNFGPTTTKFGNSTVVNVETQIGTFNGQRDLEIRLCFIKGDRGPAFSQQDPQERGIEQQAQLPGPGPILSSSAPAATNNVGGGTTSGDGFGVVQSNKGVAVIGDPFSTGSNKSFADQQRECEGGTNKSSVDSVLAHNEVPQHG